MLLKTLQHNLEAEYGKSSIPESKKADEEHFIYKPEENEISLFVMMRDARFYISPDYRYFSKEHQVSLKNNMQKIKETCIKQREGQNITEYSPRHCPAVIFPRFLRWRNLSRKVTAYYYLFLYRFTMRAVMVFMQPGLLIHFR